MEVFSSDVSDEESVVALFAHVSTLGGCELLVNNAGMAIGGATLEVSAADFMKVMSVNVVGPFLCSREAMKQMIPAGGGRIVNVGSISAFAPRANAVGYCTSKVAIDGLTKALHVDARAHNIAVGVIHPGNVMSDIMSAEEAARREEQEGFVSAENVAECVLQMVSMPYHCTVLELTLMPTRQPLVGRG